jgi:Flp pilus assembly protein TadG
MHLNRTALSNSPRLAALPRLAARLGRDRSGNSLIEFAYALPILLTLGMYGTELANMKVTDMQVSNMAMALADNASRLGQTDNSAVAPTITNAMIDSVLAGAIKQGESINFSANGRIILSSFEKDPVTNRQFFHWQRCRGSLAQTGAYGTEDSGLSGTAITGIGKSGQVKATSTTTGVMFVEAYYSYKPLFGNMFVKNVKFAQEAAFIVRDDRSYGASNVKPTGNPTTNSCT